MKNVKYNHSEEKFITCTEEAIKYNKEKGPTILIDEEDHYHADNKETCDKTN